MKTADEVREELRVLKQIRAEMDSQDPSYTNLQYDITILEKKLYLRMRKEQMKIDTGAIDG